MVDVDTGTIWCYEYGAAAGTKRKLRLAAARSWRFDRYLEQFNIDEPTPDQVKSLVEAERAAKLPPVGGSPP
jgi:hypothetical protein